MTLVDSAADVLIACLVAMASLVSILIAGRLVGTTMTRTMAIGIVHLGFAVVFAALALGTTADARVYFEDAQALQVTFALGTNAVVYLTALPASVFGLSFLATNLLFASLSGVGLVLIDRVLRTSAQQKSRTVRIIAAGFVFLPSINFWTAGIGKDAVMLLAVGCLIWSAADFRARKLMAVAAIGLALLVRPHIAAIMALALCVSVVFDRRISLGVRAAVVAAAGAATATILPMVLDMVGLFGQVSLDEVSEYIRYRQNVSLDGSAGIDITSMSLPVQLFSYVFRPTLIDAQGALELAAAVENALLLGIFVLLVPRAAMAPSGDPTLGNRLVLVVFACITLVVLAQTTANLGIAMRQKWMIIPAMVGALVSFMPAHIGPETLAALSRRTPLRPRRQLR